MAEKDKPKSVKLTVGELTSREDFGRGIVRISAKDMKNIGVIEGDVLEVEGKRKTGAIAVRAYPADVGLEVIRMDGLERRNCKSGINEPVEVRKAELAEAKTVTIAPARKGIIIHMGGNIIKQNLLMRPVSTGDIIIPNPIVRNRRQQSTFFEDFFGMDFGDFMFAPFGEEKFVVVSTEPKGIVRITRETEVELLPQATRPFEEEKIQVPEVTYEDLGGLHEEIGKVREMIELPLKHPEIFERLGIEPPKGILLHGPPGCGKTLLAKAVANESGARFYVINGPEIMCVDGETKIFTNPKGYVKAKEIFKKSGRNKSKGKIDIIELDEPITTFGIDKNNSITKTKITHVAKLVAPSYKIRLSDGNEITASHNQPFLVYENGKLIWKRVAELKKGIMVARINKLDLPEESYNIDIKGIENINISESGYVLKSKNLSRSNVIKLPSETSPELLEFLGFVVSEGYISEDGVTFSNYEEKLRTRFKDLIKHLFNIEKTKKYKDGRVVIYSKLLVKYLELLGFTGKNKIRIPEYFYKLPKNEVAAFVRGYFEGDGTVSRTGQYPTPVIYSSNREFLQELQPLMQLKLDIRTIIKKHNTPKGLMHKLVVKGNESRRKFSCIGFITDKGMKLNKIQETLNPHSDNIPYPELLINRVKTELPYKDYRNLDFYVYHSGGFTKHALRKLAALLENKNMVNDSVRNEIKLFSRDDISWEKITNIEFIGEQELYDFTVDKDNFAGPNMVLLHNSKFYGESEENLRKIFDEAEKNAPSIIFIDEIDAIAPKREEVRGEVEKRVVSQMLTLMDGLKSRGKIIVIGATNIPNALDPALRRPGRFDREIEVGVPNAKGRKEILQIHTRGMPLFSFSAALDENKELTNEQKNVVSDVWSLISKKDFPSEEEIDKAIEKYKKEKKLDGAEKVKYWVLKLLKDHRLVNLDNIAATTYGYVGADIAALCKESAMHALKRVIPDFGSIKEDKPIPPELLKKLVVLKEDYDYALKMVEPSAMREVLIEIPTTTWNDVGGLEEVKKSLKESIEWPLKNPESFRRLGIKPPAGILLYGPPGCGKTLLAKAVANESGSNFISIKGPELLSMWVGESERHLREIFRRAKQVAPSIVFFDEIDSLVPKRGGSSDGHVSERVESQLLTEMSGLEDLHDVVIMGATNRPDLIDSALLRPGRFERQILVPTPDEEARLEILMVHTKNMPLAKDVNLKMLSKETASFSGADLEALVREAGLNAMRRNMEAKEVTLKDFEKATKDVTPSVSKDMNEFYESVLKKRKTQKIDDSLLESYTA